jgi:hypothetical protein
MLNADTTGAKIATSDDGDVDEWSDVRDLRDRTPEWIWSAMDLASLSEPACVDSPVIEPPRRFRRLHGWFLEQQGDSVQISLECLDELIDGGIPDGALTAKTADEWWSNNPIRGQSRAWLNAGFVLDRASRRGGSVVFHRGPRRVETRAEMVQRRLFWLGHISVCEGRPHSGDYYDQPTGVYVLRSLDNGLYKVGVSVNIARRIRAHNSHGQRVEVVQTLQSPHRMCAYLVESVVLNLTEPWRVLGGWNAGAGNSEGWSPDGPLPDLAAVARRINSQLFS